MPSAPEPMRHNFRWRARGSGASLALPGPVPHGRWSGKASPMNRPSFLVAAACITAAACLGAVAPASAGWVQQSPRPTGLDLYAVAFHSPNHGFVGGQNSIWDTNG